MPDGTSQENAQIPEGYFTLARPELLERIPTSAQRVLELGCGAGKLGEAVKVRQQAKVVGIEYDQNTAITAW